MLDQIIGGTRHGYGSGGYGGFEERKQFSSHVETDGGYYDRQSSYDHKMKLPTNHGRPPMTHMSTFHEDDSEMEYFENSRNHHSNNHYQQPPHFMPPPPGAPHHHNGKMSNGWQGRHEDSYHGGHGMPYQSGGPGMHGAHGMQQHSSYNSMQQDRLMAPQIPTNHVYMNPNHGGGRKVVMQSSENWKVSNSGGGRHKAGWGSKGL